MINFNNKKNKYVLSFVAGAVFGVALLYSYKHAGTFNFVKDVLTIIFTSIGLYIAYSALGQVKEQRNANQLNRENLAIQELRHFENFIIKYEELNQLIIDKSSTFGSKLDFCEMTDFTLLESAQDKYIKKIANWNEFYKINRDVFQKATSCANSLEVVSTSINYGIADINVIENAISPSFCAFVEGNAYIYIYNRNSAIKLFENTIMLYKKFKPKVKTFQENLISIREEVDSILKYKNNDQTHPNI